MGERYRLVWVGHDHPYARRNGFIAEHRVVSERAVGHFIHPRHPIHHVNEDGLDNRPENLVICESRAYHQLLHTRMRAMAATGDPNKRKCVRCGTWDSTSSMSQLKRRTSSYEHSACMAASVSRSRLGRSRIVRRIARMRFFEVASRVTEAVE